MRIVILILIVICTFAVAKYIPQGKSDFELLSRHKRSESLESESVASLEQNSEENDDSDDNNGSTVNNKLLENQIKLQEKEEKLRQKEEKERRKVQEQQRKAEEKIAKQARKEQEKLEKEERKRNEKLEKEKRKLVEEEKKVEEKLRKEQLKREQKQQTYLNNLQKEILEQSDDDDFLETEEESSVELEDIWKNHIYVKYGLNFASTKQEKQAALNKYLQEELGLPLNSTVSERQQAIVKIIQVKLENDPAQREFLRNEILNYVTADALQNLKTNLENDIAKLDNQIDLLNNVSLPWAIEAKQNISDKKVFLQSVDKFVSSLLPKSTTINDTLALSPNNNIDTTTNTIVDELKLSESNDPATDVTMTSSHILSNENEVSSNKKQEGSVTETSYINPPKPENSDSLPVNDLEGVKETKVKNRNDSETIDAINQNNPTSVTDKTSLEGVTISSTNVPIIDESSKIETINVVINVSQKPLVTTLESGPNGDNNLDQNEFIALNPNENTGSDIIVSGTDSNTEVNLKNISEINGNTIPAATNIDESLNSTDSKYMPDIVNNNPPISNDLETDTVKTENKNTVQVTNDPQLTNEKNVVNKSNSGDISTNEASFPLNTEKSINSSVLNNNINDNVSNGDNLLTESTVDINSVTVSNTNIDLTSASSYDISSSPSTLIASSVPIENNIHENEVNVDLNINTESSLVSIDNNISTMSSSTSEGPVLNKTSIIINNNNPIIVTIAEENVNNVENEISTEKSGIVSTDSQNTRSEVFDTTTSISLNTDVGTLTDNMKSSGLAEKENEISSNSETILISNNLSTVSGIDTIADSITETTIPDISASVSNNSVINNEVPIVSNSSASPNQPDVVEINSITTFTETVQPTNSATDLILSSNINNTSDPVVNDPSSTTSTYVTGNIGDTTYVAVTTETNPIGEITIPVEEGAAVIEITSQK